MKIKYSFKQKVVIHTKKDFISYHLEK